jgi:outer membrane protein
MKKPVLLLILLGGVLEAQTPRQRLTLAEAEQTALRNNPRIGAAESQAQAAAQIRAQVRSALFPVVSGSVTGAGAPSDTRIAAGGINNPAIYSRFASGLTASQMITDFGRTSDLAESARLRANAEFETHKATRADILLGVNRAYIAGLRADAVIRTAEFTIAARQAIVDHAKALAESKLKSDLDVRFAQVSLSEAQLVLEMARNDRRAADVELSAALGYGVPQAFELVDQPAAELPSTDAQRLIGEALVRRPELAGRRFELEAALKSAQAERKLRLPAVSAIASFGAIPVHTDKLVNGHYAALGLNVSLPFLNGGLYQARRAEAEYKADAARRRLDETTQRIARDISIALISAQSASERMALGRQLLEQAALAVDLAQARYDLGLSSIVELSQAQLARMTAEIHTINARYDYQLQRAILGYHTGEMR